MIKSIQIANSEIIQYNNEVGENREGTYCKSADIFIHF